MEESPDKNIPAEVGGLKTVRLIGRGGMSEVYECEDPRLGSRHAVKLYTYPKDDESVRSRFETEGRLLAKLDHPRIVRVTDLGTDAASGRPYFTMELVLDAEGVPKSLGDIGPGEVDEETVGRWYDDIREGLGYIHAKGVVHRDLKLQNVLVGADGHAVITDFGISRIFTAQGEEKPVVDIVRTIVAMKDGSRPVMGSLGYMAPELELGVEASPASDYYALGVIIYHLLTGTWCDSRTDLAATLDTYDGVWMKILPKLLHANPEAREAPSYAEEKRAAAERREARDEALIEREKRRGRRARHVARYLGAALLAVTLASAAVIFLGRRELKRCEARLALPEFSTIFEIPAAAGEEETEAMPSREQFQAALIDALVLTQDDFTALRSGEISRGKFITTLDRLSKRARNDDPDLFADFPDAFTDSGESAALAILLRNAARKARKRRVSSPVEAGIQ